MIGGGFLGIGITTQFFPQANKIIVYIMLLAFVGPLWLRLDVFAIFR
jgi:hypothetical protein